VLAFIEDETGAGKTEAALILAQRMLTEGKGQGLFFALPTMATSDAMFARLRTCVARLFHGPPSLALAHGRAAFSNPSANCATAPSPLMMLYAATGLATIAAALCWPMWEWAP
jgi:hypothetical protein